MVAGKGNVRALGSRWSMLFQRVAIATRPSLSFAVGLALLALAHRAGLPSAAAADAAAANRPAPEARPATTSAADPQAPATAARRAAAVSVADPRRDGLRELARADELLGAGERVTDRDAQARIYRESLQHAERAVELLPDNAQAHFLVFGATGRLAQLDGLAAAALELVSLNRRLDKVLELDPKHANGLAARGGMLVKLPRLLGGDVDEGVTFLERAVALDPDGVGKRLELAEAYNIAGRRDDALRLSREGLAVARARGKTDKIALCIAFQEDLEQACEGCPVELIGR